MDPMESSGMPCERFLHECGDVMAMSTWTFSVIVGICGILLIVCIIQGLALVCLCRRLRRERWFKISSGKGEVNHWIPDLDTNVDRAVDKALDQPVTTASTPNLDFWSSPEIDRKPLTFIPPREKGRCNSDAKKPNKPVGGMMSSVSMNPLSIPKTKVRKSLSHGDLRESVVKPKRSAPPPPVTRKDSLKLPILIKKEEHISNEYTDVEEEDDDYENVTNLPVASSAPSESPKGPGMYAGLNKHLRDKPADYAVPTRGDT